MDAFSNLCQRATKCRECFQGDLRVPLIDVAQPRYVGPEYWVSAPKRCFCFINPGAGRRSVDDEIFKEKLVRFRDGKAHLDEVFDHQRKSIPVWGRGNMLRFIQGYGGSLEDIALLNIAWCATEDNEYPEEMLQKCFLRFTRLALTLLAPDELYLCGKVTHPFAPHARKLLPACDVRTVAHYAARRRK